MSTLIPLLVYLLIVAGLYAWWITVCFMREADKHEPLRQRIREAEDMLEKTRDRLIIHPEKRLKDKEIDAWLKKSH